MHYAPIRAAALEMCGRALLFFGLKGGNDASTNGFRGVLHESEGLKKIDLPFDY